MKRFEGPPKAKPKSQRSGAEAIRTPRKVRNTPPGATAKPALLSGGNPQIAKAEGNAAVQAYITAMPGWKRDVGRSLDALIVSAVPHVRKAVKWNSPFYGIKGEGWFLSFHCFAKYVKVAFFRGTALNPIPPGASKQEYVRYFDVHEGDPFDEALFSAWVRQASELPGERLSAQDGKRDTVQRLRSGKPATMTMKKATPFAKTSEAQDGGPSPSERIDARIAALGDWRGVTLARVRTLIREADPEAIETWKWRGVPVWEHAGILCTGETYKAVVKLTFAKGASLEDPSGLFNASLEGNTRRAIDLHEGDPIDARALKTLIRAAVALNMAAAAKRRRTRA